MTLHATELETWTPKRVQAVLIEAIRWARYHAGPTGPAPVRSLMPIYTPTWEDRLEEGWGLPDACEEDEQRKPIRRYSPKETQRLIDALYWPAKYAVPEMPTSARILNLWLRCHVYKADFRKVIERRGEMSRASAYRYRDRALTAISVGLDRDGVPV